MIKLILIIFLVSSCARFGHLNFQEHENGVRPERIVWIQIAGFNVNHIPLLKFRLSNIEEKTGFEKIMCHGSSWVFNLSKMRPDAFSSFNSQVTGKMNVTRQCKDYKNQPIWDYLAQSGFVSGYFEHGAYPKNTWGEIASCSASENYFKNTISWKMPGGKGKDYLLPGEQVDYRSGKTYVDKSCKKNICYTPLLTNVEATYQYLQKFENHFYLLRDFSYFNALKNKKITQAQDRLFELEKIVNYFLEWAQRDKGLLVLISSAAPYDLEMPKQGEEWLAYERKGKFIKFQNSSLMGSVLAYGPRAENFCGIYKESEILNRVLTSPEQGEFKYYLINPFK